jgi:tetratricopeptide (TPR) repeat protein
LFRNRVIAADTLEREGEGIIFLQSDFAQAIVKGIKAVVQPEERARLAGAEREFLCALELEPGNLDIQWVYGVYLGQVVGRFDEALAKFKRLEVEAAYTKIVPFKSAQFLMCAGRDDQALELSKKAAESNPDFINIQMLAEALALQGMYTEAHSQATKMMDLPGAQQVDANALLTVARIQALSGGREQALKTMEEIKALSNQQNIDMSFIISAIYAALGDEDQAFKYLDDAYDAHSGTMVFIKHSWEFHSLHGDPRFEELAKKVGFPVVPASQKKAQ